MTIMRLTTALILIAALGSMVGCSKPKAPESQSAGIEAAKPAPLAEASPMAQKPGLWEMTTSVPGMPAGLVSKLCVDQGLSERMVEVGMKGTGDAQCTQSNIVKTGTTVDVDSVCQMSGRKVTSHIRMEMISDSEYHQTIAATMEPPLSGDGKSTTTVIGKRLGDCPVDMKGGDMTVPGGMKINMYDALNKSTTH
ncbi:DUF3617 domain-containing protein [Asticcacaulis taihuensis]|uniref:DUF3617 family protein n=1 Tax=Asticcacaulis taihuensis TaxID=260084 RepID=A0A1G4QAV9_9CAUL|nr:DUF3617 family protein [Asticcacaulis taihuensis]SCW41601.1 Protein of unknown function [Asticcacaulis taihuensis]